jgi:2-oxoglutarate/2-oxoacid ferredoxin oxidoreductase subunit beta
MVALMLDNNIYGLTKNQTSPTTPLGHTSNTHPGGSQLPALDPLSVTLGVSNASFVAQTADWAPSHLFATLRAAHRHRGLSFVRVLQRCPVWTPQVFQDLVRKPERTELLVHARGVQDADAERLYRQHRLHDPGDLDQARRLASDGERVRLGLFYRDDDAPRYDELLRPPFRTPQQKVELLEQELDHHAV